MKRSFSTFSYSIIDCKISRKFPSTINITIYEREPIALISSDELIILDSEGVCLPVEYCDLSLPILSNFKSNPELYPKGSKTASTNVLSSINLMKFTKDNHSIIYNNKMSDYSLLRGSYDFIAVCEGTFEHNYVIAKRSQSNF